MGMPLTWPILSILHYTVAMEVDPTGSFRILGDDLIADWTPVQISIYEDYIQRCGCILNKSKSFLSRSKGVFAEKIVIRCPCNPRVIRVQMESYVPLRPMVKAEVK